MNTSTNTNQIHDTSNIDKRTTPTGFRRRTMAGALLVMALAASAVGFAAMSQAADDDTHTPATDITISAPAPVAPWLNGIIDRALHPHLHCGYAGVNNKFRCDWY